jgi:hypothetical protein
LVRRHPRPVWLLAATFAFAVVACQSAPSPTVGEVAQACGIAVRFRDQWLRENPSNETAILAAGEVVGVERKGPADRRTWHVTFMTVTGEDQPEGMHVYYLHVHFVVAGTDVLLLQVERGPDAIS